MSARRRAGFAALGKSALLLFGVPAALWRLVAVEGTGHPAPAAWALRVVLGAIAVLWCAAAGALLGDLVRALRGQPTGDGRWSRRWAAALAGLLVAASAGTMSMRATAGAPAGGGAPSARPAATASARPPGGHAATRIPVRGASAEIVALVGLGLLGAGALARRLHVLRRIAECLRQPGEAPPPPDPDSAWEEALLAPLADDPVLARIDDANRLLWRSLRVASAEVRAAAATIIVVRAGTDGIELLLGTACATAPEGFLAADHGRRWCLAAELTADELAALAAGCGRYLPALVPLGDDGSATYLLPLGPGRRLGLVGDEPACRAALAALLVALRTLPWADEVGVELVGIAPPPLAERSYQLSPSSYAELDELARAAGAPPARLSATYLRSTVVVTGETPGTAQEATLGRVGAQAGIVTPSAIGSERLVIDAHGALLEPHGLEFAPALPTPAQLALIERLLSSAARPAGAPPAEAAPVRASTGARPAAAEPAAIEVRLLAGTPALAGSVQLPERDAARVVELCAYLALHGHEASLEEIRTTVFRRPGGVGSPGRVATVCSAARRCLGRDADGHPYLPAAAGGRVRLAPAIGCDLVRFGELTAAARAASGSEAACLLERALRLVAAAPGAGPLGPRWGWFVAEGRDRALAAAVVDAAHHAAQLARAAGDTARARWAIAVGRRAEPASEQLARDLIAVCGDEGDEHGVEAAYSALESELERLAGTEPAAATSALHAALSAGAQLDT